MKRKLTLEIYDVAAILSEPPAQRADHFGSLAVLVVQDEELFFVRHGDSLFESATPYRRHQVDFAGAEAPQHDRRYGEVDRLADVAVAEFVGRAAVEDDEAPGGAAKLFDEPVFRHRPLHQNKIAPPK